VSTGLRLAAATLFAALILLLGGCAQTPLRASVASSGDTYWHGRLALRVDTLQPTSYYADFELSGQAREGELRLTTPLGTTLAQLRWNPQQALLIRSGETRTFETLDALATEATGTAIPVAALFQWLRGQPAAADGWQADQSMLSEGRLIARRQQPEPAAELRLILDQP
jgi:outer membrane lipoprotein LolB